MVFPSRYVIEKLIEQDECPGKSKPDFDQCASVASIAAPYAMRTCCYVKPR